MHTWGATHSQSYPILLVLSQGFWGWFGTLKGEWIPSGITHALLVLIHQFQDDFPVVFPAHLHFEMMIQPQFEIPMVTPHGSSMESTSEIPKGFLGQSKQPIGIGKGPYNLPRDPWGHPGPTTYGGGLAGIFIQNWRIYSWSTLWWTNIAMENHHF